MTIIELASLAMIITVDVSPPAWENPLSLDWPFVGGSVRSIAIGYGDWATASEGPHPGIDIRSNSNDEIRSPLTVNGYIIGQYPPLDYPLPTNTDDIDGSLVFSHWPPGESNWGWQFDHISYDAQEWEMYVPGTPISSGQATGLLTASNHPLFRHLHIMWMWVWKTYYYSASGDWVPGSRFQDAGSIEPKRGYVNPVEFLPTEDLTDYDFVRFGAVFPNTAESRLDFPDNDSRGLWFAPDGSEIGDFGLTGISNEEFQDAIFGVVDFAAAPYSAYNDLPERDSCGVYSVSHSLKWVNPYTEDVEDVSYQNVFAGTESSIPSVLLRNPIDDPPSRDGARLLVEMKADIPWDEEITTNPENTDEYRLVYLDDELIGDPYPQSPRVAGTDQEEMWFNGAYILSNCWPFEIGYTDGWKYVAVEDDGLCQHNWDSNFMCMGGWDTRLRRGDCGGDESNETAPISQYSLFPDGKYLVEVSAISQGTAFIDSDMQNSGTRLLPCEDIDDPGSDPAPVTVDNHRPYVDSVIVYISNGSEVRSVYTAGWDEDCESGTAEPVEEVHGYLPCTGAISPKLWVAVKYSEPMDTGPGDVWLTAEMEGEQQWDSRIEGRFVDEDTQSNWPARFGLLDADRLSGGMWQLYRYSNTSWPREYMGRLTLHVEHDPSGTPVDYNGNAIDGDPSTIAEPRESDGVWGANGYEQTDDGSYRWGQCEWHVFGSGTPDGYFYATVGNDVVQTVMFEDIDFIWYGYDWDIAHVVHSDIEYNCGAFVGQIAYYNETLRIFDQDLRVIDGHGEWVGHTYLNGPCDRAGVYFWQHSSFDTPGMEDGIEWDGKYYWIRHRCVLGDYSQARYEYESEEQWWAYNGHTGIGGTGPGTNPIVKNTLFFGEWCPAWNDGPGQWYYINCNEVEPEYTVGSGWTIPTYYVNVGDPEPYFMGNMIAPLPGKQSTELPSNAHNEDNEAAIENIGCFGLESVDPNPATSEVVLDYSIATLGHYEVRVYDVSGRCRACLLDGQLQPGHHTGTWHLSDDAGIRLPAGTYLIRLTGYDGTAIQKLIILD